MSLTNYFHITGNTEEQKNLLRHNKPQKLEGICAEINFFEKLVKPSFNLYSTGWWFKLQGEGYKVIKLNVNGVESLSSLDHYVLNHFYKQHVPCFVAEFSFSEAAFFWGQFLGQDLAAFKEAWKNTRRFHPPKRTVTRAEKAGSKKEEAINYLETRGYLPAVAVERLFADYHLGSNLWDLDCISWYDGALIGFEMKQKYPIRAGTFGLNKGLIKLFNYLNQKGIRIIHTILTKPVWNEHFSAIRLYAEEPYKSLSLWIAAEYSKDKFKGGTR